jgi:hypothetical protein
MQDSRKPGSTRTEFASSVSSEEIARLFFREIRLRRWGSEEKPLKKMGKRSQSATRENFSDIKGLFCPGTIVLQIAYFCDTFMVS